MLGDYKPRLFIGTNGHVTLKGWQQYFVGGTQALLLKRVDLSLFEDGANAYFKYPASEATPEGEVRTKINRLYGCTDKERLNWLLVGIHLLTCAFARPQFSKSWIELKERERGVWG
ncbi:MAG: hypothetical protein BWY68_00511 [bacterium ADurb.Bin400]|nr:MAG: hypothetical protein BWY68_00511 [bacterium ADurb.Bin400]